MYVCYVMYANTLQQSIEINNKHIELYPNSHKATYNCLKL